TYPQPPSDDMSITDGRVAVAHLSRGALPALKERYLNVVVVEITARPEILAERLAARGRESRGEVLARLARQAQFDASATGAVSIDNSGDKQEAGDRFVAVLRKAIALSDVAGAVE
ncbi:phosphonate metabolism protein/1,5-bisphosphokinase (PRPP-forming) PhnN, partial [Rhizobiaceae sp. 2RAB30]